MVIPRLYFNQRDYTIELYDTEQDQVICNARHPFFNWDVVGKEFGSLLTALQAQYNSGYDQGWTDAEEMLTEEQEFDC